MKKSFFPLFALLLSALGVLFGGSAFAHHSAARYDFTKPIAVSGVVKKFQVRNPHSVVVLEVTDDKGARDIEYEAHSKVNLVNRGMTPDMVAVGDTVTITIAPTKDGSDGGYILGVKAKDGREF